MLWVVTALAVGKVEALVQTRADWAACFAVRGSEP